MQSWGAMPHGLVHMEVLGTTARAAADCRTTQGTKNAAAQWYKSIEHWCPLYEMLGEPRCVRLVSEPLCSRSRALGSLAEVVRE